MTTGPLGPVLPENLSIEEFGPSAESDRFPEACPISRGPSQPSDCDPSRAVDSKQPDPLESSFELESHGLVFAGFGWVDRFVSFEAAFRPCSTVGLSVFR